MRIAPMYIFCVLALTIGSLRGECQEIEGIHPYRYLHKEIPPHEYLPLKTKDENPPTRPGRSSEYQHVKIVPTPYVMEPESPEPPDEPDWCDTHRQECDYIRRQRQLCQEHKIHCGDIRKQTLQPQYVPLQ